ncbi:MAG TPA: hypothetical protein VL096_14065 [Pirellulaceae bacterium]|nr:hypothetical protein [Pirellulaceae bacterium]
MSADFQSPLPTTTTQPLPPPEPVVLAEITDTSRGDESYHPAANPQAVQSTPGPLFQDEFMLASSVENDRTAELALAPPDGLSPVERRILTLPPVPLSEEVSDRPLSQFTLWELLILMTFLSVGCSIVYYLPINQVAGVLGLLALVGQGLLMRYPPDNRHIRLTGWLLLGMYVVAAVTAFVQHFYGPH